MTGPVVTGVVVAGAVVTGAAETGAVVAGAAVTGLELLAMAEFIGPGVGGTDVPPLVPAAVDVEPGGVIPAELVAPEADGAGTLALLTGAVEVDPELLALAEFDGPAETGAVPLAGVEEFAPDLSPATGAGVVLPSCCARGVTRAPGLADGSSGVPGAVADTGVLVRDERPPGAEEGLISLVP